MRFDEFIATVLLGFIIVICLSLLEAFPLMWLWNALMPALFGLTRITFWQAVGLGLLTSILFGHTVKYGRDS